MISNLDAGCLTEIAEVLRERLRWVSLLEYYPTNYNADVELRSVGYNRQPVVWEGVGSSLFVNASALTFSDLDAPSMIMAVGLHTSENSTGVNAWGALGRTMRSTNKRIVIPAKAIAVRIG